MPSPSWLMERVALLLPILFSVHLVPAGLFSLAHGLLLRVPGASPPRLMLRFGGGGGRRAGHAGVAVVPGGEVGALLAAGAAVAVAVVAEVGGAAAPDAVVADGVHCLRGMMRIRMWVWVFFFFFFVKGWE